MKSKDIEALEKMKSHLNEPNLTEIEKNRNYSDKTENKLNLNVLLKRLDDERKSAKKTNLLTAISMILLCIIVAIVII